MGADSGAPPDSGARHDLPAGVSADWWSEVQRSIQLEEYGIVGERTDGTEFRAANPAHRLEARFDARGVRLAPSGGGSWEWGLSLTGWGRPEGVEAVRGARLRANEDRVELDRGPVTEWFVNTPEGLEHGFTVPARPRGAGGRLVLDLELTGGLRPVFAEDGQAIDFYSTGNVSVLRYAKLVVTDAIGSEVPARIEPITGGVRIVVDDLDATYPLTVDPLATSPSWTAVGEGASHFFGVSVATAGDVNGDGYSDVVVGAYGHTGNTGKAYLYLGGASGLSATPAWTATGETTSNRFGISVATAGDVNGDGYSDVVVGADGNDSNKGKAYLYLGGVSNLSATPSWTAAGEAGSDQFAFNVATAGDSNGDGYSDVVIGAPNYASGTGKAYVFLGGASGLSAAPFWSKVGEAASNFFGFSVATAGDVNGDGYSDLVAGAPRNASRRGKAYVYLGGASGLSTVPSWTAVGAATNNDLGISVATAGDVNGDGYSDIVIGAAYRPDSGLPSDPGRAYVYLGGPSGPLTVPSWSKVGEAVADAFGTSVATAGDVDGDGYSDVVIGAPGNAGYSGKAYLYRGGASGLSATPSWTAVAEAAGNNLGVSVATAGDVNGDGHSDVVLGAPAFASGTGKAYLYLGGAGALSAAAPWTAVGEGTGHYFGSALATAGDVNGDGYSDVVVGAYGYAGGTGKAYLYLGGASGLSTAASWTVVGEGTGNSFGSALATAGDVNGDGYSDVLIGARLYASTTGKVYLYPGGANGLSTAASWTAVGEGPSNNFGGCVATAGDVNGDGYSDVVIGADNVGSSRGKAYLYLGGASSLPAAPSWTAVGEATGSAFGNSVATAGDVNGDGYSDVVIGAYGDASATGKAYVFLGRASGLSATASWTAVGEGTSNSFGSSLATAGDVNGDGYSDVVVGAYGNASNRGKAYLYLGGTNGLSTTSSWTAVGEGASNYLGYRVATAGDVNGDGYSDVVIGAPGYGGNPGKAYLHLGGASGPSAAASWTALGENLGDRYGWSLATAGDVNGDGYSDVVIAAWNYADHTGKAYLYLGGSESGGVSVVPRQMRADLSAPISLGGAAYQQWFRLGLTLHSPAGRVWRNLQWQTAPLGGALSPRLNPIRSESDWLDTAAAVRSSPITLPENQNGYVWRARTRYSPVSSPYVPWGPWFTMSGNGLRETDLLSTSAPLPPPCGTPDEELYISSVTRDANGKPVLNYQDPNQPGDVTGYNIYRAPAPTGAWTRIASNVVDMDEGTPNQQYVDQTGDIGGSWYYKVAAFNAACGVEGPW